jgi:PKD repeat protein
MLKTNFNLKFFVLCYGILIQFYIASQPNASFTVSPIVACVGDTITMTSTSTSTNPISNYIWSATGAIVEAGSGPNLTVFKFVYAYAEIYNLSLVVQDSQGLASSILLEDAVTINENPIAIINSEIIDCTLPFLIDFSSTGSTTGASISYSWQFPSASPTVSSAQQVDVTYNSEGDFQAKLTVTNNLTSCSSLVTKNFTLDNFLVDFTVPNEVCYGELVTLVNTSSTSASGFSWTTTAGSINNASASNPLINFNVLGSQTISLTATNAVGCTDTETKTVEILNLPEVSFTHTDNFGCAPKIISFTNTSPNASSTYTWDFDDLSTPYVGFNPSNHTYTTNNLLFFPILHVVDDNGCENSFTTTDSIYFFPIEAHFSATPIDGCAPVLVQFTNQSYSVEAITSFHWDFDDGTSSTLENPTHTFNCGEFDVRLIIQNQNGCIDTTYLSDQQFNYELPSDNVGTTLPDNITILVLNTSQTIVRNSIDYPVNNINQNGIEFGALVTSEISVSDSVLCSNQELTVNATVTSSCLTDDLKYIWTFEGFDNETTNEPFITNVFFDTLNYSTPMDIGLIIDHNGCSSPLHLESDMVYLKGPVSSFLTSEDICNPINSPYTISINDISSIYGHTNTVIFSGEEVVQNQTLDDVEVLYVWGDGTSTLITDDNELEDSNKGSTSHNYLSYGTFEIKQYITNHTTQCTDSSDRLINISFVEGSIITDSVCLNQDYQIQASGNSSHFPLNYTISNSTETYTTYNSDLSNITIPNNFVASVPGNEILNLIITNDLGCSINITKPLITLELPIADLSYLDDTVCLNTFTYLNPGNSVLGTVQNWSQSHWLVNQNFITFSSNEIDTFGIFVDTILNIRLKVEDAYGCISENAEGVVLYPQEVEASFTTNEYLCNDVNELLDASSSEGIGILTYAWYLDNNFLSQSNNDSLYNIIQVNPPTLLFNEYNYSLFVTDSKGCQDSVSHLVFVSNPRITDIDSSIFATYVDINGNFTCPPVVVDFSLDYTTNFAASNYQWSFGNDFDEDFDSYNETPLGIQYYQAGTYDLLVQMTESVTGCVFKYEQEAFLTIGGPTAEVEVIPNPGDLCGLSYLFQVINPSDNLDHWDWNLGDGNIEYSENHPSNSFIHTYLNQEDFNPIITIYDDSLQCAIPISVNFDMVENGLNASFTINPSEAVVDLGMEFIDASTTSAAPIETWIWNFGDGDSVVMNSYSNVNHTYLNQNAQEVVLTIIDTNGCTDQYSLPINLFLVNFEIPNIITNPNGNGTNSFFVLFTDIFIEYHLIIVNRWGNVVHDGQKDPINPLLLWNGTDDKNQNPCVDGVYFYILEGTLKNGKNLKLQDYLTISGSKQ